MLSWIEQLNQDHEVVRVITDGKKYLARVVPHRHRSWRIEIRADAVWTPVKQAPRGPYGTRPTRYWRSPVAAMQVAESLFTSAPCASSTEVK